LAGALREARRQRPDFLIADYRLRGGDNGLAQLQGIELAGLPLLHKPMRLDTLVGLLGSQGAPSRDAAQHSGRL